MAGRFGESGSVSRLRAFGHAAGSTPIDVGQRSGSLKRRFGPGSCRPSKVDVVLVEQPPATIGRRAPRAWVAHSGQCSQRCECVDRGSKIGVRGEAFEVGVVVQDRRPVVFGDRCDEIVERRDAEVLVSGA